MIRETYVTEDGQKTDYRKVYIKRYVIILIAIVVIVLIAFIYMILKQSSQNTFCKEMRSKIKEAALKYVEKEELMPEIDGEYVSVSLDDLVKENYISKEDITVKESTGSADITITKYNEEYIVTVDLENAEYCSTLSKSWGKETSEYNKNKDVVEVVAYYNYRTKETNYTKWSNEVKEEDLNEEEDKTYQILLPKDEKKLPTVPTEAEVVDIEMKKNVYYQYQDKKWKYYDIAGDYTNFFSAEKPDGYENYDNNTLRYTEWSEFSLNYPEEKSYRKIETRVGYRWYYMDGKNKVYYNNGNYAVEVDDEKYDQKEEESVKMYRYRDREYRWYNGKKRKYSTYYSTLPKSYTYRDDELFTYTSWTALSEKSNLTSENSAYRTEREVYRYQYRMKYNVYSLDIFEEDLTLDEFLKATDSTLEDIMANEDYDVEISFKFRYK